MSHQSDQFLADSEKKVFDKEHRRKLSFNIQKYDEKVVHGKDQYADLELAKQRAANLKWKVINSLDKYLIEFEANFIKRGGKVIWAQNADEAMLEVVSIMNRARARTVVK